MMIYGLYKFLRERHRILDIRFTNGFLALGGLVYLYLFQHVGLWYIVPTIFVGFLIQQGALNKPYLFFYNQSSIYFHRKFLKHRIFVRCKPKIKFSWKKKASFWSMFDEVPDGIIFYETGMLCLDATMKEEYHYDKAKVLERQFNVEYCVDLRKFLESEIEEDDKVDMIKKKLLLYKLTNQEVI